MNIDELLRQRYGQDRFNPAAGQSQMTLAEWLDRHPGRANVDAGLNQSAYNAAMRNAYTGPQSVDAPMQIIGPPGSPGTGTVEGTPPPPQGASVDAQMSGPDSPPVAPGPVGGSYKDFVRTHGGKSTAGLAAVWSRANGRALTPKMQAAQRRQMRNF